MAVGPLGVAVGGANQHAGDWLEHQLGNVAEFNEFDQRANTSGLNKSGGIFPTGLSVDAFRIVALWL